MPADDPWSSEDVSPMPVWTPREPAAPREPTDQPVPEPEQAVGPEPVSPPEPEPEPVPEPEPEPEPVALAEAEAELEQIPASARDWPPVAMRAPVPVPAPEPEPESVVAPRPEPEPEPREGQATWPERGDSTQVLPTTWTPREPAAPDRSPALDPVVGRVRVSLAQEPDASADAEEEPSTAEQAVPWLIGVILLLAGMVIVLLALIFAGDASLGSGGAAPSDSPLAVVPSDFAVTSLEPTPTPTPTPTAASSGSPVASAEVTPTAAPVPKYGALEMVYQGRNAALAPIYLLRRDFTQDTDTQVILAQDASVDVRRFAWSRDGTAGVGLLADILVSIEPGQEKRRLADGISTITFGDDASTVYAVRLTEDGANEVATVLAVDFASGSVTELAAPAYARPSIGNEDALAEAQFADEGGPVRLYWVEGGTLRFWALGAGTWEIDPDDGTMTELEEDDRPTLWAPNGERRIRTSFETGTSTITLLDDADEELLTTTVEGRVSHLRWAPDGQRITFTVGSSAPGGGVLQDLFLWDLNEQAPMRLTPTGAAFGAEWIGAQPVWRD